jgi:NAD(P)-dependent dehydrogenase (short-subunit alcohol dehydrogenase family)
MTSDRTLVVVGWGPGISHAVAERWGREGYRAALIGRTESRLTEGITTLGLSGVDAHAYPADASSPDALRDALARIRADLGPVSAVLWTAFRGGNVRNVLDVAPEDIEAVFDIGVRGLLTTVQVLRDDLVATKGSVLVANGALGEPDDQMDGLSVMLGGDGTSLENAAKSKLVGLLASRLANDGVYVGQITLAGSVAGTATASPTAVDPALIADRFWAMAADRTEVRERVVEQGIERPAQ